MRTTAVDPTPLVVLVTGGGSGLGASVAHHLAAAGHRVHVAGRRRAALDEVVEAATPGSVVAHTLDVTDPAACEEVVAEVLELRGRLDVLVNNAGLFRRGRASAAEPEEWATTLRTNLDGAFHAARAAVAAFRRQEPRPDGVRGQVLNVNSGAGTTGYVEGAAYSASKFGLMGFSDALRQEVCDEGIRVTDVVVATAVESELSTRTGVRRLDASAVGSLVLDVVSVPGPGYLSRVDLSRIPDSPRRPARQSARLEEKNA